MRPSTHLQRSSTSFSVGLAMKTAGEAAMNGSSWVATAVGVRLPAA